MELFHKKENIVMGSHVFNYSEIGNLHLTLDFNTSSEFELECPGVSSYDALRDAVGMAAGADQLIDLFKAFGRCSSAEGVPDETAVICDELFEEFSRGQGLKEQFWLTDNLSKYRCL